MVAEMKTLRDTTIGEWEKALIETQRMIADYPDSIDETEKELEVRAKEIQGEVEEILSQSQNDFQQIKTTHLAKLRSREEYLEDRLRHFKAEMEKYENQLTDGSPNDLIQFQQRTNQDRDETTPPPLETTVTFKKGQNDAIALLKIFGQLSTENTPHASGSSTPKPATASDSSKAMVQSLDSSSVSNAALTPLIPYPSVQYQFTIDFIYPIVACVEQGQAWVMTGSTRLQLVYRGGMVIDGITTAFGINDMTVTSDGDLLLADCSNSCIKSVTKQKNINTLFTTQGAPSSLSCLQNDDIVVTFHNDRKVIVYKRNGRSDRH